MNRDEIKEKLIGLCSEIFQDCGVDMDLIEYVDFVDDLGMDSISFISLIVEIEACFGIMVPDDLLLMDCFKNIDDVVQIVVEQLDRKLEEGERGSDDEA